MNALELLVELIKFWIRNFLIFLKGCCILHEYPLYWMEYLPRRKKPLPTKWNKIMQDSCVPILLIWKSGRIHFMNSGKNQRGDEKGVTESLKHPSELSSRQLVINVDISDWMLDKFSKQFCYIHRGYGIDPEFHYLNNGDSYHQIIIY